MESCSNYYSKTTKNPENIKLYKSISLLPMLFKVYEKLLAERLQPIIEERKLIPITNLGSEISKETTEQVHKTVKKIKGDIEEKIYCSTAFLDINQAFNKVSDYVLFPRNLPTGQT